MHRREFLSAAAVGLLSSRFAFAEKSSPSGRMTLGYSTYGMKMLKTEQAFDEVRKIGYDAVELSIHPGWDADSAALTPARCQALRRQLDQLGLKLRSMIDNLPIDDKLAARTQRLERIKLAAKAAHALSPDHPPILQTVTGGGTFEQKKPVFLEELAAWLKLADSEDLTIAIKPHRGGAMSRPGEAVELIKALGEPQRLRMCYDYAHYDLRDMPLEETIRTAMPWVAHVAVKDVVPDGDKTRFVLPGEGKRIDYPHMLKLFHELGYRGDVCVEISAQVSSKPDYDPIAAAKISYANMSAAFTAAGIERT
jgi:inosose dehydratase